MIHDKRGLVPYAVAIGEDGGLFAVDRGGRRLAIIASWGGGWDHASVHVELPNGESATPTWDEMCLVKDMFFEPTECAMQLHPPAAENINVHPHVLHLWRPQNATIPMPPRGFV